MKKTLILLFCAGLTTVGFSQQTNNESLLQATQLVTKQKIVSKTTESSTNLIKAKPGEKIQTTVNGNVISQEIFSPTYPTTLLEQKSTPLIEPKKN